MSKKATPVEDLADQAPAVDQPEDGVTEDPETGGKIIELRFPVSVGNEEIDRLVLKRPKLKHLRQMDKTKGSDMEKTVGLIVSLSGQPAAVVDALDAEDMTRIVKVFEDFFGPLLGTGQT